MLKIALSKGVLLKPSINLLRNSTFDVQGLEGDSRRLLIQTPNGISYILARPSDVPTYVEYGAADLGITGKDALLENETDVFELKDLKLGKCRFVLAQPKEGLAKRGLDYQHLGQLRIATKYPRVANNYLNKRGLQAEIITLRGSIELAPLTGLSDMIIDLTSTGKTLAENELEEVDEIAKCSARLIANTVSVKLKYNEIQNFVGKLKI